MCYCMAKVLANMTILNGIGLKCMNQPQNVQLSDWLRERASVRFEADSLYDLRPILDTC